MGVASREGRESWDCNSFVEACRTFDVHVLIGIIGTKFTIGYGGICYQFVDLMILVEGKGSLPLDARIRRGY